MCKNILNQVFSSFFSNSSIILLNFCNLLLVLCSNTSISSSFIKVLDIILDTSVVPTMK